MYRNEVEMCRNEVRPSLSLWFSFFHIHIVSSSLLYFSLQLLSRNSSSKFGVLLLIQSFRLAVLWDGPILSFSGGSFVEY